jgi:hypothetical protein
MSRARHEKEHKRRAKGGSVHKSAGPFVYAGGGSNVMEDAKERKRGGRVHHMHGEGEEAHERHDRKRKRGGRMMEPEHEKHRKRGGRVHEAHGGTVHHHHHEEAEIHHHHKRAAGGRIGANERPLSTAARTTKIKGEGPESFPSD